MKAESKLLAKLRNFDHLLLKLNIDLIKLVKRVLKIILNLRFFKVLYFVPVFLFKT